MLKVQIGGGEIAPFEFKISAIDFCGEDFLENGKFVGEIKIVGEVVNNKENLKIRGKVFCQKEFICDRCLSESTEKQVHDFVEELNRNEIIDNAVDITEIIHDVLIISQPIKNLCSENCKGLCPICGFSLNNGDCECDRFIADPRLAVLQDFKAD